MKKILLSILLLIITPLIVTAEVDYDITDYYIESFILDNGDLQVKELFVLDGTFNGYERDLNLILWILLVVIFITLAA